MRILKKILPLLFLGLVMVSANRPYTDDEKNQVLLRLILQGMESTHFNFPDINDAFSVKVYDNYLDRLDHNKRLFQAADIKKMKPLSTLIDDEAKLGSYRFFDLSIALMNANMEKVRGYYKKLLDSPFDYELEESIETDPDKYDYPKNDAEMRETWRRQLKYQALIRLESDMEAQKEALAKKDTAFKEKTFKEMEANARKRVLESYDLYFERMDKLEDDDWRTVYINSILGVIDPHTEYFPPAGKANFDIAISGRLEGIGATLQEKDGYIKIVSIVPGGAAWRQGDLDEGDKIMKVAQGPEESVDIVGFRVDNAVKLIRGKKGTEVRLTVKKVDGRVETISIIRDVVELGETYAKSTLLKSPYNDRKVGYIDLPKFYADFTNTGGRNSSDDVRKEVQILMKEDIEGLIIDLRNNSGGSLQDVVDMAGIFIDQGPIVQVKAKNSPAVQLSDREPGVLYDGPLVIMVNSFSASASEILAAAMQDYHRAVIIGGSSTYGKGTVQRFIDLDGVLPPNLQALKPLGSVKVTMQKFYRVDGGATQQKGVVPDIILPDTYTYLDLGEKEYEHALPWDQISPANYSPWNLSGDLLQQVESKSGQRTATDTIFQLIDENSQRLKRLNEDTRHSLVLETFHQNQEMLDREGERFKTLQKQGDDLKVYNITTLKAESRLDSIEITKFEKWEKNLKKDIYVDETLKVVHDLAKLGTRIHPVAVTQEEREGR